MRPSERSFLILTGLVVSIFLTGSTVVAVLYASGTFDDVYEVRARFGNAGQGLIKDSDVKIRGVNVGEVESVELDDAGRALVTLQIRSDEKIPVGSQALVRPKTLFGEKFVNIEVSETAIGGPTLGDGDEIESTVGSIELERVLVTAEELLDSVRPADLAVILDTLAGAVDGQGERIRRQIQNWSEVAAVFAKHDADTRQFLDDFETLSGAFDRVGDDIVATTRSLNEVLPPLNARGDQLDDLLDDAADVSRHLAEVLEEVQPTLEKMVTEGGKTIQVLHDNREQVPKLVVSLRDFAKILAQAGIYEGNFLQHDNGAIAGTIKFVLDQATLVNLACAVAEASEVCTLGRALPGIDLGAGGVASTGPGSETAPSAGSATEGSTAVVDVLSRVVFGVSGHAFAGSGTP